MARALEEALLDIGIKHVNFFEGRILTGRDLRDQQGAESEQRKQLGQAIGSGVVEGFKVTTVNPGTGGGSPILHVEKGLAVNRAGQTLLLPQAEDIVMVRADNSATPDTGLFLACATPPPGSALPNGSGFYLLTVGPASGFQGDAPKSGLGDAGKGVGCGRRYATQGLRFRLLRFDPSTFSTVTGPMRTQIGNLVAATSGIASLVDAATRRKNLSLLRNLIANILLGSGPVTQFAMNPGGFGAPGMEFPADPLADIRGSQEAKLTNCEVPLTLLYWTVNGVEYVDTWAARRVVRQSWDAASLALPIGFGLERMLQFQEQASGLNAAALAPENIRVEQYFRFLPPAGFYPAVGAGSSLGMRTTVFLAGFNTGQVTETSAGMAAEILVRSFLFPPTDLQTSPFLQQYSVTENQNTAANGTISQLQILFADRALNGPSVRDGVWETFSDAWQAYRGLIRKRVFLPMGATSAEAAARVSVVASTRDVLDLANRYAARAGGWTLDEPSAHDAFSEFYEVQKEYAELLSTGLPGVTDTQGRTTFAAGLLLRLDGTVLGNPGLAPALALPGLVPVVLAQDEINRYVGQWSGEGVAVGPFLIQEALPHPDGNTIVPGATSSFRFRFVLRNGTDRRLQFAVAASTEAPGGTWAGTTTIHKADGTPISSLDLNSGAFGEFLIHVKAPSDAVAGQTAVLTVEAAAPPPTSRSETYTLSLLVGTASTPPVTRALKFEPAVRGPNPVTKASGQNTNYPFLFTYTASSGPDTANIDMLIELRTATGAPLPDGWNVMIGTLAVTKVGGIFRATIPAVARNIPNRQSVIVTTGPAGTVNMRATVQSSGLTPQFSDVHPDLFSITST